MPPTEDILSLLASPLGLGAVAVLLLVLGVGGALLARSRRRAWEAELGAGDSPREGVTPKERAAPPEPTKDSGPSLFGRLVSGLSLTQGRLVDRIDDLFSSRKQVDEELWTQLEELLITSDVGVRTTTRLLESMRKRAASSELQDPARLRELLRAEIRSILVANSGFLREPPAEGPLVIMVVGVNGAGKTTTIGKLAARHTALGRKVIIGAGDTFRAAAIEQVVVWGKRSGAEVVKHGEGADPAAVAHDAVQAGIGRGADVVICDTAGRLHTQDGLMKELGKVHRVISKVMPDAPHEVLLVIDSTNGQNAIAQAREFTAAVGVTGIALTKLDGTAKGGVIVGVAEQLGIPVKLIGIGEALDDLRDFEPETFVSALFGSDEGFGRGGSSADAAEADRVAGITTAGTDQG